MLLIVLCYVQLVELFENLLNMFEMFFCFIFGEILVNEGLIFVEVDIFDFIIQVVMFVELIKYVLMQINVVIGVLGVRWMNIVWYGLLIDFKGQELLMRELGVNG